MRILGLDFGSKTVGVAVTDPLGITAQGVEIIRREKETHMRPTFRRIGELIEYYGVDSIVLGLPLNRAEKTLAFKEELERKFSLPVFLVDERLTTVEADQAMEEAGIPRRDFKKYVDMIAAVIILRDYMNR